MMLSSLVLIFVYISVLLIKSCDMSAVSTEDRNDAEKIARGICKTYGFGETAEGATLIAGNTHPCSHELDSLFARHFPLLSLLWPRNAPCAARFRSCEARN